MCMDAAEHVIIDEGFYVRLFPCCSTDAACHEQLPSNVWRAYTNQVLPERPTFFPAAAQI